MFFSRLFASPKPMDAHRAGQWTALRGHWLVNHPTCAACGGDKKLNVHHIKPFHLHPELELDIRNLMTLCEGRTSCNCHLTFGHLGDWTLFNPNSVLDAADYLKKYIEARAWVPSTRIIG